MRAESGKKVALFNSDLEQETTMSSEEWCEHQRFDSHELDEDVERWTRGVLERVSNGVTDNCSLVWVRSFRT